MKTLVLISLSIICLSCSKDPACVPDYFDPARFPVELQPLIKTFLAEGNQRGVYCDINKLRKIEFKANLYVDGVKASGYYSHSNNAIYIDSTSVGYTMSPDSKERTMFHELGHALLKREHRDDLLKNGTAASIMNSNNRYCYVTFPYMTVSISYRRPYYIDELFHPETPAPYWVN